MPADRLRFERMWYGAGSVPLTAPDADGHNHDGGGRPCIFEFSFEPPTAGLSISGFMISPSPSELKRGGPTILVAYLTDRTPILFKNAGRLQITYSRPV